MIAFITRAARQSRPGARTTALVTTAALASFALAWWMMGGVHPVAFTHDEFAYLLQADTFAHGRWTAPLGTVATFFEQVFVLTSPSLAAKYPPGHALWLAIPTRLGVPGLLPILCSALSAALVVLLSLRLVRRTSATALSLRAQFAVGALTWAVWAFAWGTLYYRASYLSESTSSLLWLLVGYGALRFAEGGRTGWLTLTATAAGWCAITRPLTALALAPVALALAPLVWRRWQVARAERRQIGLALLTFVSLLSIWPIWSVETTGRWTLSPVAAYTAAYLPTDRLGFGGDAPPPTRALPPGATDLGPATADLHRAFTPRTLPRIALARLAAIAGDTWGAAGWVLLGATLLALGLADLTAAMRVALASGIALFVLHLAYAHETRWCVYYVEAIPIWAFFTARGAHRLFAPVRRRRPALVGPLLAAGLVLAACHWSATARQAHAQIRANRAYAAAEAALLAPIPRPAVVFVRAAGVNFNMSLVHAASGPLEAPLWLVHDRGVENASLLATAGGRRAYLLTVSPTRMQISPMP